MLLTHLEVSKHEAMGCLAYETSSSGSRSERMTAMQAGFPAAAWMKPFPGQLQPQYALLRVDC